MAELNQPLRMGYRGISLPISTAPAVEPAMIERSGLGWENISHRSRKYRDRSKHTDLHFLILRRSCHVEQRDYQEKRLLSDRSFSAKLAELSRSEFLSTASFRFVLRNINHPIPQLQ